MRKHTIALIASVLFSCALSAGTPEANKWSGNVTTEFKDCVTKEQNKLGLSFSNDVNKQQAMQIYDTCNALHPSKPVKEIDGQQEQCCGGNWWWIIGYCTGTPFWYPNYCCPTSSDPTKVCAP